MRWLRWWWSLAGPIVLMASSLVFLGSLVVDWRSNAQRLKALRGAAAEGRKEHAERLVEIRGIARHFGMLSDAGTCVVHSFSDGRRMVECRTDPEWAPWEGER